jgi:hypothetical protein
MIAGYTPGVPVLGTISTIGAAFILLGGYALVKVVRRTRERRERAAPAVATAPAKPPIALTEGGKA